MDIGEKTKGMSRIELINFLKSLSAEQRIAYDKYKNNERQKKYKKNETNRKAANERSAKTMQANRKKNPEKYKAMNIVHNKTYQEKKPKATKKSVKMNEQAKNDVMDILNDIIDTIPKKSKDKKTREAVAKFNAKKQAGEPTRTYNTRSKLRTLNLL